MLVSELREELIGKVESQLQIAVESWQNLDPQVLQKQPATGGWSAAQCIAHLNFYGRYYLPAIEKALGNARKIPNATELVFQSGWLGSYFTKLMKKDPSLNPKAKLKAPKNAVPTATPDSAKEVAEFIDHLEHLLQLLQKSSAYNVNALRIPISISPLIRLKLGDIFNFLIAHNERHIRQAERARGIAG